MVAVWAGSKGLPLPVVLALVAGGKGPPLLAAGGKGPPLLVQELASRMKQKKQGAKSCH